MSLCLYVPLSLCPYVPNSFRRKTEKSTLNNCENEHCNSIYAKTHVMFTNGGTGHRLEDNITIHFILFGCEGVDWIYLARDIGHVVGF